MTGQMNYGSELWKGGRKTVILNAPAMTVANSAWKVGGHFVVPGDNRKAHAPT